MSPKKFPGSGKRLNDGRVRVFPRHPDWPDGSRSFDALYELVREVRIPCSGPTPATERIGSADTRRCAFCEREAPTVTFKKEAHTVPAGFGNRHALTLEECDECNESFGEELDQQLVNYLSIDRVIAGCRKRGVASIKLKAPDESYLEFDHQKQRLVIGTDPNRPDAQVRMGEKTASTFELTVHGSAYSFDHVVRNLIRLAWMLLRSEDRAASPEYLEMILGHRSPTAWQLFRVFVPAGDREVVLSVWRVRTRDDDLPATITSFVVGHTQLIWASCDGQDLVHRPGPLPAFEFDPDYGDATLTLLVLPPGTTREAAPETMTFGHTGLVEGDAYVETPKTRAKRTRPLRDITLRWHQDGSERRVATKLDVHRNDGKVLRLKIGGDEFGADLVMHREGGTNRSELDMDLAHQPAKRAHATLDALAAMSDASRGAIAYSDDEEALFQIAGLEGHGVDFEALAPRLRALVELATDLGVQLTVPGGDDKASWATLGVLATARARGEVALEPFGLRMPQEDAAKLQEMLAQTSGQVVLPWQGVWRIDGTLLEVGSSHLQITAPCEVVIATTDATTDATVTLAARYVCKFDRWALRDENG